MIVPSATHVRRLAGCAARTEGSAACRRTGLRVRWRRRRRRTARSDGHRRAPGTPCRAVPTRHRAGGAQGRREYERHPSRVGGVDGPFRVGAVLVEERLAADRLAVRTVHAAADAVPTERPDHEVDFVGVEVVLKWLEEVARRGAAEGAGLDLEPERRGIRLGGRARPVSRESRRRWSRGVPSPLSPRGPSSELRLRQPQQEPQRCCSAPRPSFVL